MRQREMFDSLWTFSCPCSGICLIVVINPSILQMQTWVGLRKKPIVCPKCNLYLLNIIIPFDLISLIFPLVWQLWCLLSLLWNFLVNEGSVKILTQWNIITHCEISLWGLKHCDHSLNNYIHKKSIPPWRLFQGIEIYMFPTLHE